MRDLPSKCSRADHHIKMALPAFLEPRMVRDDFRYRQQPPPNVVLIPHADAFSISFATDIFSLILFLAPSHCQPFF